MPNSQNKEKIKSIFGAEVATQCLSCSCAAGEVDTLEIMRTQHFFAQQDYEIPIPGFIILSSIRHFSGIDEMNKEEAQDFTTSLINLRSNMREVLGIADVYLFQNEDSSHHFHLWLFPRHTWMEQFGRKIESVRPIMQYAKEHLHNTENIQQVRDAAEIMKERHR